MLTLLASKVYIVTGGTSGLGFGITAHLLQHNASKIVILSSNQDKAREAIEKLEKWGDISRLEWHYCDLGDLKQVDSVARKLKDQESRIDGVSATSLACYLLM
jgi:WW domain-containing oxidoreductase